MITLTTKTFCKKAKKEVLEILGESYSFRKSCGVFVLRNKEGKMLGHVTNGKMFDNANLVLAK